MKWIRVNRTSLINIERYAEIGMVVINFRGRNEYKIVGFKDIIEKHDKDNGNTIIIVQDEKTAIEYMDDIADLIADDSKRIISW